ncbi:Conserved_hypothetical protein [Hexamita inflata]|uniref:Uncharacterized protein n=1 Tax=Hexamita inflata TaxID=28002 RepID=A0ABP1H8Z2_9EUKA
MILILSLCDNQTIKLEAPGIITCISIVYDDLSYIAHSIQQFNQQTYTNSQLWFIFDYNNQKAHNYINNYAQYSNQLYIFDCSSLIDCEPQYEFNYSYQNINILRISDFYSKQKDEILQKVIQISKADYFVEWSSIAYHDKNRIQFQLQELQRTNQSCNFLDHIYQYNHFSKEISQSCSKQLIEETIFCKSNLPFPPPKHNGTCQLNDNITNSSKQLIYVSFKYQNESLQRVSFEQQQNIISLIKPKTEYDGIFSLGTWCQTGGALAARNLFQLHSPIHGFGIKTWENLIQILDSKFNGYWDLENMVIGKVKIGISHRYHQFQNIFKVYDNRYNMYSNHQFDEIDNSPTELKTYPRFKEMINQQVNIFLKQNQRYERVLFVLRAMSAPMYSTVITEQQIIDLHRVLTNLRNNKPFTLIIHVQEWQINDVNYWLKRNKINNVVLGIYKQQWNDNPFDEEWEGSLKDVKLAENYWSRLFNEILEIGTEKLTVFEQWQIIGRINGWN